MNKPDHQDIFHLDKHRMRHAFDQAAAHYDEAAVLQREVGERLLERLDYIRLQPSLIVDIGAGTGRCSKALVQRYPQSNVISVDLAPGMLQQARRRATPSPAMADRQQFICGDAEQLPLASGCADLVFSNLTLQWCNNPDLAFKEFMRILKPGGLLMFSTLGPDTLKELRLSWANVDGYNHVNAFIDMHDIGDALMRAHYADPVMDVEHITVTYPDVYRLMRDLKAIGAHNVTDGRPKGLTGKRRLQALAQAYETFRREGTLPATYEVLYGHAWAPIQRASDTEPGTVKIFLDQLRHRPPYV